jgi:hypothetical protein
MAGSPKRSVSIPLADQGPNGEIRSNRDCHAPPAAEEEAAPAPVDSPTKEESAAAPASAARRKPSRPPRTSTAEAWGAFLKSYPEGFLADLARAYLLKLGGTPE